MKTTSVIAAAGATVLGVGLIGFGAGVGANFSDSASGTATISTGSLSCGLSSTLDLVKITDNGHQAAVNLPQITSSAAGSQLAPLTVTNTGQIPMDVSWTTTTGGNILGGSGAITTAPAPSPELLAPGKSQTVQIGFTWTALQNSDEGRSGSATYKVSCDEVPDLPAGITGLTGSNGGSSFWDGSAVELTTSTDPGSGAVVHVADPGAMLPDTAPTFTTSAYHSGSPRLQITFNGTGDTAVGYPASAGSVAGTWHFPGMTGDTWADLQQAVSARGLTVRSVYILADGSAAAGTVDITCIDYGGQGFGGSCS